MNKTLLTTVSILALAGCGKKKAGDSDMTAKYTEFKDAMCKCKAGDSACAKKVTDDQMKWGQEMAKTADTNAKVDPNEAAEMAKKMEPIMAEYNKCMTAAMTAGGTEPKPGPSEVKPSTVTTGGKGLGAAGNDAEAVALAKKALACKWGDWGIEFDCADAKVWNDSKLFDGKNAATLVNMLEDAEPKVHSLAVTKLSDAGKAYRTDKALSERIIVAAETENAKVVDGEKFGYALAQIQIKDTGLLDRLKAAFGKMSNDKMKLSLVKHLAFDNHDDGVFEWIAGLTKDADAATRNAALSSFWTTGDWHQDDICKLLAEHWGDPDANVAETALQTTPRCPSQYDAFLDVMEKRAKAADIKSGAVVATLTEVLGKAKATEPQIKRTTALVRTIVMDAKISASVRTTLMEQMVTQAPKLAKEVFSKLQTDKDATVAAKAKELAPTIK